MTFQATSDQLSDDIRKLNSRIDSLNIHIDISEGVGTLRRPVDMAQDDNEGSYVMQWTLQKLWCNRHPPIGILIFHRLSVASSLVENPN